MEILENKLETISRSNCRVGKISSSIPLPQEDDKFATETGFEKRDFETSYETARVEIF
jgi:hypothetical protein